MKRYALILSVVLGLAAFAPQGVEAAGVKLAKASGKQAGAIAKCDFTREFKALEDAAELLADVHDEKAAQKAAKKICSMFNMLPPPMGGTDDDLERWATKANKLNYQMERLRREKWFVSSGLQEAWTLATDPFSRRRAEKR